MSRRWTCLALFVGLIIGVVIVPAFAQSTNAKTYLERSRQLLDAGMPDHAINALVEGVGLRPSNFRAPGEEGKVVNLLAEAYARKTRGAPEESNSNLEGKARFIVIVPTPDAQLFVEDAEFKPAGLTRREFTTKPLDSAKEYLYSFRTVVKRDGVTYITAARWMFRANHTYQLVFGANPVADGEFP